MLVVSRKANESLIIDDHIIVTIIQIQGNRVRFAIEAPKDVRIFRAELQPRAIVVNDADKPGDALPDQVVR